MASKLECGKHTFKASVMYTDMEITFLSAVHYQFLCVVGCFPSYYIPYMHDYCLHLNIRKHSCSLTEEDYIAFLVSVRLKTGTELIEIKIITESDEKPTLTPCVTACVYDRGGLTIYGGVFSLIINCGNLIIGQNKFSQLFK